MNKFSERFGYKVIKNTLQIDDIDDDLKNKLWNLISSFFLKNFGITNNGNHTNYISVSKYNILTFKLWHEFFKENADDRPESVLKLIQDLKTRFFEYWSWYEIYDFLEFLVNTESPGDKSKFIEQCNFILENELSGYRFVKGYITPITNEQEIKSIEEALNLSNGYNFKGVENHLKTALALISDKNKPDYRNSVKESVSAIESIAKTLSGNQKDSLGGALDKIKGKIKIHPSLERGFKQIYGYTSDSDGIRHAMTEESTTDFEDAKFMLVSSSAFINYLIGKSIKSGINLE